MPLRTDSMRKLYDSGSLSANSDSLEITADLTSLPTDLDANRDEIKVNGDARHLVESEEESQENIRDQPHIQEVINEFCVPFGKLEGVREPRKSEESKLCPEESSKEVKDTAEACGHEIAENKANINLKEGEEISEPEKDIDTLQEECLPDMPPEDQVGEVERHITAKAKEEEITKETQSISEDSNNQPKLEHVAVLQEKNVNENSSPTKREEYALQKISKKLSFNQPELDKMALHSESFLYDNRLLNIKKRHEKVNVENMDPDTVCGIGCFRPQWLQQYATARTYLVIFSIIGVLQGSYYSYLIGILTTLEKRYAFKSKVSGTIMMVDEITPLFLGIFVGYFGGRAHRPRMVGIGMFMSALCCFVSALPYFMYGPAQRLMSSSVRNETGPAFCDRDGMTESCEADDRPPTVIAVVCLFIGSFLKGFGNLAYYAIGMAYMDDTAKKKNTPIYFAISSSLRLLGPIVGFLMSSAFLKYYEDPMSNPGFGPEDPRWVGAWWMGFVLQGILLLIFSCPMFLFPRRLPRQRTRALSNTANFDQENLKERIAGLMNAVKRLIKNPLYLWFTLSSIFSIIGNFGYFIMMPKYMESQFRLSASDASLLSGPPAIAAVQIATVVGGVVIWKWRPTPRQLIGVSATTDVLGVVAYMILLIPSCSNYVMTGTTFVNRSLQLENECNAGCNCTTSVFTPICGSDGVSTYFSPCHAGCTSTDTIDNVESFHNCSCMHDETRNFTFVESVKSGFCVDEKCWQNALAYIITLVINSFVTGFFRVGHTIILLRSVDTNDKSIALGMFETLICTFAFIPYPVLFGSFVDSACLIWETSCGETGNCWFYDVKKFKYLLHGVSAAFVSAAVFCYVMVFCLAQRMQNLYEDDPPPAIEQKPETEKENQRIVVKV